MDISWVQFVQLFFSLSILIALHEGGHFLAAKMFKTRVEKFYIFFDFLFPLANVLNFSLWKKKIGETEYGLGWFPLGGYVKIAGMVDESMDKDQLKEEPKPDEYRAKPAWQRLIIIMGGIIVNIITGILIYMFVLWIWGESYLPNKEAKYGIMCDSTALSIGLQNGDKIISLDGKEVENFNTITKDMILGETKSIKVDRNGQILDISIPEDFLKNVLKKNPKYFISPRFPFVVDTLNKKSIVNGKLFKNDSIIAINNKPITYFDEFKNEIVSSTNQEVQISVLRKGQKVDIATKVPETGILGIMPYGTDRFLNYNVKEYSFFEAIPGGFVKTYNTLAAYIGQFKLIFSSKTEGYKRLGGFGAMANAFPKSFTWEGFFVLTAFISVALAFMNFLPIPMLDGGYVIFILWEMITGKEPSQKFMEYVNYIGMIFLLGLMLYANLNDWIGKYLWN